MVNIFSHKILKQIKNTWLIYLILIFFCKTVFANINVQVDPPFTSIHEPFRVTYTLENIKNSSNPDFSPLKNTFIILGTEQNSQYHNINGHIEVLYQWSVILMAKKTGIQTIPSIYFGTIKTPIAHIEVVSSKATSNKQTSNGFDHNDTQPTLNIHDSIKLKSEVDDKTPLVNQQIIYTVKLYNNGQLLDTDYHPPQIENALLIPLKNGYRYHTNENGQNFMVEAQSYAIFPQKTGNLSIQGPTFNALIFENMPKRIQLTADNIELKVQDIPQEFNYKNWLPAKSLFLEESYSPNLSKFTQGNTLVRTIKLQATGIPAELIPDINFKENPDFDIYQEKPELDNSLRQQNIVGTLKLKINYILHKHGTVTIPEINISWYNTITGKKEISSFPAKVLYVAPKNNSSSPNINHTLKNDNAVTLKAALDSSNLQNFQQKLRSKSDKTFSFYNLVWLGLISLIAILCFIINKAAAPVIKKHTTIKKAWNQLKKACINNEPLTAKNALLKWFALKGITAQNLDELAKKIEDINLKEELNILSKTIYDKNDKLMWQGNSLLKKLKNFKEFHFRNDKKNKNKDDIPPMNPR